MVKKIKSKKTFSAHSKMQEKLDIPIDHERNVYNILVCAQRKMTAKWDITETYSKKISFHQVTDIV